jgi:16S rRNA (uracil1498-N3)-methyltransferase
VPTVHDLQKLATVLDQWPHDRNLLYCDECLVGTATEFSALPSGKWAILIGPEGGFSDRERTKISNMQQSFPVSLGPRILRADTAAVAALSLWQEHLGDWC